jgi:hypothetical protein
MPASRHVGSSLCIAAASLCIGAAVLGVFRVHQQLATAAGELVGGEAAGIFAAGEIVNGCYSNRVVGVVIELPKDWHIMSLNAMRRAKHSGAYAAAGDDARWAEQLAAARRGVYALLAARRYPDAFTGYNPSLTLNAYDKRTVAATGVRTLEAYASSFTMLREPYHTRNGPSRERFGTETGYHVHVEGRFPSATIQQHVYATETDTLYLVLTASVMDERDLGAMQQAISTLRVIKTPAKK